MEKEEKECNTIERLEELRRIMEKGEEIFTEEESAEETTEPEVADEQAEETFEESLAFLDDMVGMEGVKEKLLRIGRYVQWRDRMKAKGIDTSDFPQPNLTFMFLGEPGTGKTTVAYRMGRILHSLGLLPSRKVMEFRREDLIGENYGSEELATKEALRRSRDSVFFLDEAYQCFKQSTDKRDPGYHILETMMAHFEQPGRCIIMAGYKNEMMELFKVNPGFQSRIPKENIIEFRSTTEDVMLKIAMDGFRKLSLRLTSGARSLMVNAMRETSAKKGKSFGNARAIVQFVKAVVINHANRVMISGMCDDMKITKADIMPSLCELKEGKTEARTRIGFA